MIQAFPKKPNISDISHTFKLILNTEKDERVRTNKQTNKHVIQLKLAKQEKVGSSSGTCSFDLCTQNSSSTAILLFVLLAGSTREVERAHSINILASSNRRLGFCFIYIGFMVTESFVYVIPGIFEIIAT